jgi:tetratricopeptide (TPR) repeat protein
VKVEQALRLLPTLEAMGPLRGLVLASSFPDEAARWGSAAPYLTVGKWGVSSERLRHAIPAMLAKITTHLSTLYQCYADALDADAAGDLPMAVGHLLTAARLEEKVGRLGPALAWGEVALAIAEGLNSRKGEIEVLTFLGGVSRAQGLFLAAARHYQRALVLAEAESDLVGAIVASEGQGLVALAEDQVRGANVWLGRGERIAEECKDDLRRARILRSRAEVARRENDLPTAKERLEQALATFERLEEPLEMARTMEAKGRLFLADGEPAAALAAFREALAWAERAGRDPRIESGIRIHLAEVYLTLERVAEAEEEMRNAEKLAIGNDLGRRLIQVYSRLGALRGRQGRETGFVFFEQALALCHLLEPLPALEAEVFRQYGLFKSNLGRMEEARGWLERARESSRISGGGPSLAIIEAELAQIPA